MSRDAGHDETEEILREIEKRISREYKQAEKEVAAKLDDYLKRFETKDKIWQAAVKSGERTQKEYEQWRLGQIMTGKRWAEMRLTLAEDYTQTSQMAKDIAVDRMPEVYAINHNYGTFQVEKGSQLDTSYTLYDRDTVIRLASDREDIIPVPGQTVKKAIKEGKAVKWNERQIQSVMMQSLLQGEAIPKIASRLAFSVGEMDRKASIRNARTLATGVQNAGRVDSYKRANKMGINTKKQWLAALDSRTRHWHRDLDGVIQDVDKPFENDIGKIMYPGDPKADGANIYNCRCTLIAAIKGFERDLSNTDLRYDANLGDMSYNEWKKEKKSTSHSINKQDKIARKRASAYNKTYRKLAGEPDEIQYYRKTDNDSLDGQTPAKHMYKMSESIGEAKKYAEDVLGLRLVDYDGINLDYANVINETITKYYNTFANLKLAGHLDEIRIVSKLQYEAGYQPITRSIFLQKRKSSASNVMEKLAEHASEMKKIGWWSTGDQYTLIRHELGHAVCHLYLDEKAGNPFGNSVAKTQKINKLRLQMMKDLGIDKYDKNNVTPEEMARAGNVLSYYALKGDGDFVAEAVAEYMSGKPREMAKRIVEILIGE